MSGIVNAHTITHATVGHVGKTLKLNKKKMEKNGQAARDWSRPATGGKRIQLVGFNSRATRATASPFSPPFLVECVSEGEEKKKKRRIEVSVCVCGSQ